MYCLNELQHDGMSFLVVCYNRGMSNNSTTNYTIDFVPVGDHLQVTIPEIGITVETGPGETRRDDVERVALAAISRHEHQQYEAAQAKAS
jgi:hypothetical protein